MTRYIPDYELREHPVALEMMEDEQIMMDPTPPEIRAEFNAPHPAIQRMRQQ